MAISIPQIRLNIQYSRRKVTFDIVNIQSICCLFSARNRGCQCRDYGMEKQGRFVLRTWYHMDIKYIIHMIYRFWDIYLMLEYSYLKIVMQWDVDWCML